MTTTRDISLYVVYNFALTPSIQLTPDVRIIDPSQRRFDTAVVVGARLQIVF